MKIVQEMFNSMNQPIWMKDENNKLIFINNEFKNIFLDIDDNLIKDVDKLLYEIEDIDKKCIKIVKINGKTYKQMIWKYEEKFISMLVDCSDVIEKASFGNEKNILKTVIDNIPELIFYKDKELKYIGLNKHCEEFYEKQGITNVIGKNDLELPLEKQFKEQCNNHDQIVMNTKKPLYIEESVDDFTFETIKTPIVDEKGNVEGLVGIVRDISDYKRKENMLKHLSYTDSLTGIYNRTYFDEKINELLENKEYPIGLILGDMNGLKIVNDTLGHLEGDKLLQTMSNVLVEACDNKGFVFRWGGDEFAILLPQSSNVECTSIMNKINEICDRTKCGSVTLSISKGYAILNEGDSIDKVLVESENKVYKQKLLKSDFVRTSLLNNLKSNLQNKNVETEQHTERVAQLCIEIAKKLNLSDEMIERADLIGRLHDIGKIAISEHILLKPSKLNDEEYETMKSHSEKGYRLASLLPEISCISKEILTHHERWDGNGYPLGLKKDEIPILARIVSIADSFDAMTNDRCYRKGITTQDAIDELRENAGTQFDPYIVDIFLEIITKK